MKLTDKEISTLSNKTGNWMHFARAIEAAVIEKLTKVDVEPIPSGLHLMPDLQTKGKYVNSEVDVEPVKLSPFEDFCYCDHEISLQMVSGGAAPEGLYGRVTLQVKGEYVDYVPDSTLASLQAENERLKQEIQNQYKCIESHAKITQAAEAENERLREALKNSLEIMEDNVDDVASTNKRGYVEKYYKPAIDAARAALEDKHELS